MVGTIADKPGRPIQRMLIFAASKNITGLLMDDSKPVRRQTAIIKNDKHFHVVTIEIDGKLVIPHFSGQWRLQEGRRLDLYLPESDNPKINEAHDHRSADTDQNSNLCNIPRPR